MKVIVFGATGMVGQGVVREALADPDVDAVLLVGRSGSGVQHPKVRELLHADLSDFSAVEQELAGYDACFFCLGVSAAGMTEAEYAHVTYDFTLAAATTLARFNSGMTFIYVSGAGTDSTEESGSMWARVKGKTENALLKLRFKAAYVFRPAYIQPLHGAVSKTKAYRWMYAVMAPLYPVWRALFPRYVTTTEKVGRAMLKVARNGAPKRVLENADINALATHAEG